MGVYPLLLRSPSGAIRLFLQAPKKPPPSTENKIPSLTALPSTGEIDLGQGPPSERNLTRRESNFAAHSFAGNYVVQFFWTGAQRSNLCQTGTSQRPLRGLAGRSEIGDGEFGRGLRELLRAGHFKWMQSNAQSRMSAALV
jgi:hypothetical protein